MDGGETRQVSERARDSRPPATTHSPVDSGLRVEETGKGEHSTQQPNSDHDHLTLVPRPVAQRFHNGDVPVQRDGDQREDGRGHRQVGNKVVDGAVESAKRPVVVEQENEVEDTVQGGHEQVSHTQVQQVVVGDGSHPSMRCAEHKMVISRCTEMGCIHAGMRRRGPAAGLHS